MTYPSIIYHPSMPFLTHCLLISSRIDCSPNAPHCQPIRWVEECSIDDSVRRSRPHSICGSCLATRHFACDFGLGSCHWAPFGRRIRSWRRFFGWRWFIPGLGLGRWSGDCGTAAAAVRCLALGLGSFDPRDHHSSAGFHLLSSRESLLSPLHHH